METLGWMGSNGALDLSELDPLAITTLHEIGHFLGLRHSTEASGSHDALPDTPECTASSVTRTNCAAMGSENLMFPDAPSASLGISITAQQADVVASMLPGPALNCALHTDCGDHEICVLNVCESAYWRWYTMHVDELSVATTGPSGAWDDVPFVLSVPPDPFLEWLTPLDSGVFATQQDTFGAAWFGSIDIYPTASGSPVALLAWDDDTFPYPDDLIDSFGGGPIGIDDLRSPSTDWNGAWSTLSTGFEPQ
jgi:hypothetical protein